MGRGGGRELRRALSRADALGQRLRLVELGGRTVEVVGISAAARPNAIIMPPQPFIFLPLAQHPSSRLTLIAHTRGDAAAMAAPLRSVVQAIDADVPVYRVETTQELFDERSKTLAHLLTGISTAVGLVGLTMALIGLYALVAYQVSRRTRRSAFGWPSAPFTDRCCA